MDTPVHEERSVLRVVLPGTSFPLVNQGAKEAAKADKRPLRASDYKIVTENQVAAFTPSEWAALPEVTKARFGFISQSDVQTVALVEMQKPIDEWQARVEAKKQDIAKFVVEVAAAEHRNSQTLHSMRNDLGFLEGEVSRLTAEKSRFEAKVQAEIDARAPAQAPVLAAVPASIQAETVPAQKGGRR